MANLSLIRQVFTGSGITSYSNPNVKTSYAWVGVAPYIPNQAPNYTGIVNAQITLDEAATVTPYATTAYNGFQVATQGTTLVSGSLTGFVQASDPAPGPPAVNPSRPSSPVWLKFLIGSLYYECTGYIEGLSVSATPDDVVIVNFNFTLTGRPIAAQLNYVAGGSAPQ